MNESNPKTFVSRAGEKLEAALRTFAVDVAGRVCADLGSHTGGFVDCLLRHAAARVYAVDTAYGTLAWTLRRDPRVVVLERCNAMHVTLPKKVSLVTIDVGWTPQAKVLPNVAGMLEADGAVISLVKPHYEAPPDRLRGGVLPDEFVEPTVRQVLEQVAAIGWRVTGQMESPLRGHGGNREWLVQLRRTE